jgi:hypothetical protein
MRAAEPVDVGEVERLREALLHTRSLVCKCAESGFGDEEALMELYRNNGAITAALASNTRGEGSE